MAERCESSRGPESVGGQENIGEKEDISGQTISKDYEHGDERYGSNKIRVIHEDGYYKDDKDVEGFMEAGVAWVPIAEKGSPGSNMKMALDFYKKDLTMAKLGPGVEAFVNVHASVVRVKTCLPEAVAADGDYKQKKSWGFGERLFVESGDESDVTVGNSEFEYDTDDGEPGDFGPMDCGEGKPQGTTDGPAIQISTPSASPAKRNPPSKKRAAEDELTSEMPPKKKAALGTLIPNQSPQGPSNDAALKRSALSTGTPPGYTLRHWQLSTKRAQSSIRQKPKSAWRDFMVDDVTVEEARAKANEAGNEACRNTSKEDLRRLALELDQRKAALMELSVEQWLAWMEAEGEKKKDKTAATRNERKKQEENAAAAAEDNA